MMRDRTLWTLHIAAAAVILVLLGLHMGIMHLDLAAGTFDAQGSHPVDWASVVVRTRLALFTAAYVALLAAALYHGLYGLRNILLELNPGARLRTAINWGLSIAGLALFAFGTWAALAAPGAVTMGG
jgi:succinate dehydrogenase hydrophobic anchor subunit